GDPEGSVAFFAALLAVAAIAYAAGLLALCQRPGGEIAADVGARIAEVSHELRTPLTHILGFAEMIERRLFGDINERYSEYAGLIRKSGNHLLGLVNDLLDISRIEAGRYPIEREIFDARSLVEEVVRLSTDAAQRKTIALAMITPEAPIMVSADAAALRRIIINLVGNALKFSPEGARVAVSAAISAGSLVLEVTDTGPGIPAHERARLAVPYERGGGAEEGAGLGLSLVRALAALHGGELSLLEAPGGGALIRVSLPVLVAL
ncbi:MAG: HAMP domain-containing sensor histidine kinase, partial [Terricaulis sp.]